MIIIRTSYNFMIVHESILRFFIFSFRTRPDTYAYRLQAYFRRVMKVLMDMNEEKDDKFFFGRTFFVVVVDDGKPVLLEKFFFKNQACTAPTVKIMKNVI